MQSDESVFIKIDKFKDAGDIVRVIKSRIAEGKSILGRINDLKNKEDQEIQQWNAELNDVEKKIEFIEGTLFEPEV